MASGTGTVTIDTNEWVYVDRMGIEHTVTDGETFTFSSTDNSTTSVVWKLDPGQSVATDDGYTLYMDNTDKNHFFLEFADTDNTNAATNVGEWVILDPQTGQRDVWVCTSATVDDVDAPSTIAAKFEAKDDPMRTFEWAASVDISFA